MKTETEKFKGTKGQWYTEFNPISSVSPNGQFTVKAGEIGTPVCMLPMPLGGINTTEKLKANASLISAAPEMLELLQSIMNTSEDFGREGCTYGDTDFDSLSAAHGYNQCLNDIKSKVQRIIIKALNP